MRFEDILNGAGALVAFSAPLMMLGLYLRSETLAQPLRRLAIWLALVLPILFMAIIAAFSLQGSGQVFFDFAVNYRAATALYGQGADPYSVQAAYSFPFPTFLFYWIVGGFGRLNESAAWIVWWLINGLIWLLCVVMLWRTLPRPTSSRERDTLLYIAAAIPAIVTLWQGQTALLILAGLVVLHQQIGMSNENRAGHRPALTMVVGGLGLAIASLIKPQLALIGIGIGLWGLLAWRNQRRAEARLALGTVLFGAIAALVLVGLTIILPGGVTFDTYQQFVTVALPQIARPADGVIIGSPAFAAAFVAYSLGIPDRTADLLANGVTLLVLGCALLWTIRRADRPLTEIAAGWGVWAMVAPRVAWTWYAAWCLPFFLLAAKETLCRSRSQGQTNRVALAVLVLALLNLQLSVELIAFGTILLLVGLLWTSFRPVSDSQRSADRA